MSKKTLHTAPSPYGSVVVYDCGEERYMAFEDSTSFLSCVHRACPHALAFPYTQAMTSFLLVVPDPRRILCVGLGAGSLPRALAHLCPEAVIDTVEINPTITRLAKTYFGFAESERCRVHTADARAFIEEAVEAGVRYDAILLDAFDAQYVPPHLTTRGFFRSVAAALTTNGVVLGNTFASRPDFIRELATYRAVWPEVRTLRVLSGNVIVAASDTWPDWPDVHHRALAWSPALADFGVPITELHYRPVAPSAALPLDDTALEGPPRCTVRVAASGL